MRRWLPLLIPLAAALAAACQPLPPPPYKAPPVPDRVAVAGDSITVQALYYGAAGHPAATWDEDNKIGLGWRASHAQPQVTADVADPVRSYDTLVAAFGHNYGRGFTQAYRNEVTAFVFSTHADTCLALVLPYAPPTLSATHQQAIADYRAHVQALAAARPNTVVVDWAPIAQAHPKYLDTDGIHLNTPDTDPAADLQAAATGTLHLVDPGAAAAYVTLLEQGAAACA